MTNRFIGLLSGNRLSFFSECNFASVPETPESVVFASGYVSNRAELHEEARSRGEPLPNDLSGCIARTYRWWGRRLSRHVLGQFAAAVVDTSERTIDLIQDSLGIHRLYYSCHESNFYFASRLLDLVAVLRPSGLDFSYFADLLANGIANTSKTPYPAIQTLHNGETLHWDSGELETSYPWNPRDARPVSFTTEEDLEDALRTKLRAAVAPLVQPGEIVWSELSGGLDSTSVFAVARSLGYEVEPFTFANLERSDSGDTEIVGTIVSDMGTPWHRIESSSIPPFSSVPIDFLPEPGDETHYDRQTAYRSFLIQNGVNAVLTGGGGDVTFGSPDCLPHHLADPLYAGNLVQLWRDLRSWQQDDPGQRSLLFWFRNYSLRTSIRHALRRKASRPGLSARLPSWLNQRFTKRYQLKHFSQAQNTPRHPEPGRHALWEEAYFQASYLGRLRAKFSPIEFRHPLLDRTLLEFMFSIPFDQRQRANCDRYIQRRALRHTLPQRVLERHTKGSGQPAFDSGFRASDSWWNLLTEKPRLVSLGFVDRDLWMAELQRARFGLYESLAHFVSAVCIECWCRRYEKGLPNQDFSMAPFESAANK